MKKIIAIFLSFNLIFLNNGIFYICAFADCEKYPDYTNIDSINRIYYNTEYPKRLVNSLLQRDIDGVKQETKRFVINIFLDVAGLFDFACKIFNIENYDVDMEQAFAKYKIKCKKYPDILCTLGFYIGTNF